MKHELDHHQQVLKDAIRSALISGKKKPCVQATTGFGKTVVFASIANDYLKHTAKDVLIFTDAQNIFKSTRKTLLNWHGIDSDIIDAKQSHIASNSMFGQARVFLAMVETFFRRSSRNTFLSQLNNVGLVIIDECHIGNFRKILKFFPNSIIIGFTATPKYSTNKWHMNQDYDCLIQGPTTRELIEFNKLHPLRGVVEDLSYGSKGNVDFNEFESEGDDLNLDKMGETLSGNRQINNTIEQYVKYAPGKKMICFNANVKHSELVTLEMNKFGLNARHIDASAGEEYRTAIYQWLAYTPNAILCNVGMTTKGFDEPSLDGVILNRATKSLTLYNQMCGRGARPFLKPDGTYKTNYILIDMCDNIVGGGHGRWSDPIDWKFIFDNPKKPIEGGIAPRKECPECGYICYASARVCPNEVQDFFTGDIIKCGYEFPSKSDLEDQQEKNLVLINEGIDVMKIIDFPAFKNKKEYFTWYETIRAVAYQAKEKLAHDFIDRVEFEELWKIAHAKTIEWQTITGRRSESGRKKPDTKWFYDTGRLRLVEMLREYGFYVDLVDETEKVDETEAVNEEEVSIKEEVEEFENLFK